MIQQSLQLVALLDVTWTVFDSCYRIHCNRYYVLFNIGITFCNKPSSMPNSNKVSQENSNQSKRYKRRSSSWLSFERDNWIIPTNHVLRNICYSLLRTQFWYIRKHKKWALAVRKGRCCVKNKGQVSLFLFLDILSGTVSGLLLWKYCQINLDEEYCKVIKEFWLLVSLKMANRLNEVVIIDCKNVLLILAFRKKKFGMWLIVSDQCIPVNTIMNRFS